MATFSWTIRRLAGLGLGTLLVVLGACGREPSKEERRAHIHSTSQELVAAAEYYVGFGSMAPKQLALTFDDGPGTRTAELSTYLKNQNIRAVFFVNGACVQATALPNNSCATPTPGATAILAQLEADGHLVGNHTTTHRDITTIPAGQRVQELSDTDALITLHGKTPYNRSLFRAPFGSWSSAVRTTLQASAMSRYVGPIYWDIGGFSDRYPIAAADWACFQGSQENQGGSLVHSAPGDPIPDGYATTQECGDAYLAEINSVGRGIILMHDQYSWAQGNTIDMVKYLVPLLKNAGYTFLRADEVPIVAADLPACAGTGCISCSGPAANQCTTCAAGRYLSGGSCLPCSTSCAPGTYLAAACTANANITCTACDPSCTACSGPGANACTSCATGKFLAGGACSPCTACAAGSYVGAACSANANTVCTACTACGPGFYASAPCTATKDSICSACHPSCKACSGPDQAQCAPCPSGSYAGGGACNPCTTCAAGSYASSACSPTADTSCTACAVGTYAGAGATTCTACASGTYAAAGATECTSCGSCDDGNACTTDACSATSGCTHAPIAGCTASASPSDAGAPSTPAPSEANDTGCTMSSTTSPTPSLTVGAFAGLGLLALRRRRARR